jgi:hypothetical protein
VSAAASQLDRVQAFLKDAFQLSTPIVDDAPLATRVAEHVTGNDRLSPAEQADLYRRQFFLRHVEALLEDHPGIAHYLGEDGFEAFACAYLAKHPPKTPSLRDLGADVADFAATWEGLPEHLRPVCVDMARYELCIVELFDAENVPPPDAAQLAAVPQEAWLTRPLVLTPLLRLLEFRHPVPELRVAIKLGECAAEPPAPEPAYHGVFRRDDRIAFERLPAEAFALLRLLAGGAPLAGACEDLSRTLTDEAAARVESEVGDWFQRWASWGWILGVNMEATDRASAPSAPSHG